MAAQTHGNGLPCVAVRGTTGIHIVDGTPDFRNQRDVLSDPIKVCRCFAFSEDGCLFAWCNTVSLQVYDIKANWKILEKAKQKTSQLSFSSSGNFLSTWEGYCLTAENPTGFNNLEICQIGDGNVVKGFVQKRLDGWEPQWTDDELLCARSVNNEVHFYENRDFSAVSKKLYQQNVTSFSLAPGPPPYRIAIFVKGTKAAPSFVRLFQFPNLENQQALANKSFFKADKVDMHWNKKGTCMLILTSTEVDTTGASYYGEQALHFVSTRGDAVLVPFDKKGPIYSVDWNPNCSEFCVIYGYMPAKAKIYNVKCEPIFDFGTGQRNLCFYNPHGNRIPLLFVTRKLYGSPLNMGAILCLAGFGNLRGVMEIWNVKGKKLIAKPQAPDSTFFEWSPDGVHFLTATTSPRLKIDNGYKIWHYTGNTLHHQPYPDGHELYQISWQPAPEGVYKETALVSVSKPLNAPAKVEAYRPPSARATGSKGTKLHEEEPAQNMKPQDLTGAALKNKKKREARSKNVEEQAATTVVQQSSSNAPLTENQKKIKNLKKKLRQIEDLRQKQKEGKTLEKNQLDKIKSEEDVLLEIKELELADR